MSRLLRSILSITIVFSLLFTLVLAESNNSSTIYFITGNNVRFRSSPHVSDSNIIGKFRKGQQVEVLQWGEEWVHILYDGQEGFVSIDYIQEALTNYNSDVFSPIAGYTTTRVHFRKGPGTDYESIDVLPQYTSLQIIETNDDWSKVIYLRTIGYVSSQYISIMNIGEGSLLGTFTTYFSTKQKGRSANIQLAVNRMNELIIAPGETFSLLNAIGPVTQANGYQEAPEFKKTSEGTITVTGYGGGVCQIATTLYQSVLAAMKIKSSLRITEHHHHSKSVSYIEDGEDATISWDAKKDFQFINDNDYFLKVMAYVMEGSLTVMIVKL